MIFTYSKWEDFCKNLACSGIKSVTASSVNSDTRFLVLKHDIETNVCKALKMAEIEHKYGHCGSYYVQAYLLDNAENVEILKKMKAMGHEITYHHDVMDSNGGNIEKADEEFRKNIEKFEYNGFKIFTVCQHGNPVVERLGYFSNRDFFRNEEINKKYEGITDIMVNYKDKYRVDYDYFSDAGRKFKLIFDPINNDIVDSENKNICFDNLNDILDCIEKNNCVVSIHPHRWCKSAFLYFVKNIIFKIIKTSAKILMKIPLFKKIMNRYYFLAKKI